MTRPRVVLAEDNHVIAQQLRRLLESRFDVVGTVNDGKALLTVVEACRPDAIVTDIAMPLLSGLAASREILRRDPKARIVLVTIRDEPSVIKNALSLGVLGYVLKCDAAEELAAAVLAAMDGTSYVSSNVRRVLDPRFR